MYMYFRTYENVPIPICISKKAKQILNMSDEDAFILGYQITGSSFMVLNLFEYMGVEEA